MTQAPFSHDEAMELAGLYALDALTPDEKAAVDAHLAACALDHSEIDSLGGVAPAIATMAEPVGAPAALKRKVLDAYAAEHPRPMSLAAESVAKAHQRRLPTWMGWAAAGLALVLLVVLGAYGLNIRQQADAANQRAQEIAAAVAALAQPGSQVAILRGSGAAAGVSGFAAFPADGSGYMVLTDVPAAPAGKTYQAWYIVNGQPASAGTMQPSSDGNVVASGLSPIPGTTVVAVTVEPSGGSDQPTSDPIIAGNVTTPAKSS